MSYDVLFVFFLIAFAVFLFYKQFFSFEITALILTSSLMLSGILSVEEGFSGLNNQATITIGSMFVVTKGLREVGVLEGISNMFEKVGKKSFKLVKVVIIVVTAIISAFINNTASVSVFIPVVTKISRKLKISSSKILLPLSYASILGGTCTLIGTSTNVLVKSIAASNGIEGFAMFDFFKGGIFFFIFGLLYLMTFGNKILPDYLDKGKDLTAQYKLKDFVSDVVIKSNYSNIGKTLEQSKIAEDLDLDVIRVFKKENMSEAAQRSQTNLEKGDVVRVRGTKDELAKLEELENLKIEPVNKLADKDFIHGKDVLVEASLKQNSSWVGKPLSSIDLPNRYGILVLAIRKNGELIKENMDRVKLQNGDSLLMTMEQDKVCNIVRDNDFNVVSQVEEKKKTNSRKIITGLSILLFIILMSSLNILPIVIAAFTGAVLMVVLNCITTEQAYKSINWNVIFLLAGILPLGVAMSKTGADKVLSELIINYFGSLGNYGVLAGFFLATMVTANFISNQASAALFAPLALQVSHDFGISPIPLLYGVAYAASLNFMTPIGYQTNVMVFNAGRYKFTDFTKMGAPLSFLMWILGIIIIPIIWTF